MNKFCLFYYKFSDIKILNNYSFLNTRDLFNLRNFLKLTQNFMHIYCDYGNFALSNSQKWTWSQQANVPAP